MSSLGTREHQMFPVLSCAQIEVTRHFTSGPARHFQPAETVYAIGERGAAVDLPDQTPQWGPIPRFV